jgi:hypothetical protein
MHQQLQHLDYYIVHKFQSHSRITIHLGVYLHHVTHGKCIEFIEDTKLLIQKEVSPTLDANFFVIWV